MFKKWRSCLLSVLLLCSMFFGLYSNTLQVEAANVTNNFSFSTVFYPNVSETTVYGTISGGGGYINNGTGQISSNSGSTNSYSHVGYSYHVKVPFTWQTTWTNFGADTENYYSEINKYFAAVLTSFSVSSSNGTMSNVCLYDKNGKLLCRQGDDLRGVPFMFFRGTDFNYYVGIPFILEYDVAFQDFQSSSTDLESFTSTVSVSVGVSGRYAQNSEIQAAQVQVSDAAANQSLDAIEQSSQDIATSVTSDTGGGLLATIKNFFGGFFSNLIYSILGLFVPDSDYFSTWFNNLNTLLSDKLGMLYAPFDLLISTLNAVYSADSTEPGIVFPGFEWEGQTVIEPYTFYFSSLGEEFQTLRNAVYFGTDVIFLFAFLYLLQKKIALVITGSEVNG